MVMPSNRRLYVLLAVASVTMAALWVLAWPWFGGAEPFHAYTQRGVMRLSLVEGNLYLGATVAQLPLLALLVLGLARAWTSQVDERLRNYLRRPGLVFLCVGLWAAAVAYCLALFAYREYPVTEDEKTYLFQAKLLLLGRLSMDVPPEMAAFNQPFLVAAKGGVSGQYFWAHPALLAVGEVLGSPYLISALLLAATVYFSGRLAEEYAGSAWAGLVAAVLVATSPLLVFTSGTLHNSTLAATCGVISLWALARLRREPSWTVAIALGVSSGIGLHNRVLDQAVLLAAGLLLFFLDRGLSPGEKLRRLWPAGVILLPFLLLHLAINQALSGDPLRSGYALFNDVRSWKTFGLGRGPFGFSNDPVNAATKTFTHVLQLLFVTTGSVWVPAATLIAAAALVRDSLRAVAPLVLPGAYLFAYLCYAGFSVTYAGPVYFVALVPPLTAWMATLLTDAHARLAPLPFGHRLIPAFLVASAVAGFLFFWPTQLAESVRVGMASRACLDLVERHDIDEALVFVEERPTPERRSWLGHLPMISPSLDDRVLFVAAGSRARDAGRDARVAAHYARGRPIFYARCVQDPSPTLNRYDPNTGEKTALP